MFPASNEEVLAAALRAARAALNWSQAELAERAGVSIPTIARIEATLISPKVKTMGKLLDALEKGGVCFTWVNEPGVYFTMTVLAIHPPRHRS